MFLLSSQVRVGTEGVKKSNLVLDFVTDGTDAGRKERHVATSTVNSSSSLSSTISSWGHCFVRCALLSSKVPVVEF